MIPILFDRGTTSFTTNGIGRLRDASSCTITEARNGEFILKMKYPIDGAHYSDIKHGRFIYASCNAKKNPQAFEITRISRPLKGQVDIEAEHISYRLNNIPFMPFSAQGVANALNGFKNNAAEACPFTFWTNKTSTSSYAIPIPGAIRSYLGGTQGSILDIYGGEYEFDNWIVKLWDARGRDNGIVLRYGKNLTDLKQEENIETTYTGVCPYWMSTEGQLVTLPEKVVHSANAANFPYQRTIPYDFTDKFENAPTEAQLRSIAQAYVRSHGFGVPKVSLEVSFVNLSDTEEYKNILPLQSLNLCDTVTVQFEKLGVNVKSKVVSTTWDALAERYTKIEIGERRTGLAQTIEDQIDKISVMPTNDSMRRSIDLATGTLNSGLRGYVVINRNPGGWANEILFLDNENIAQAKNVLRINNAGIGFSSGGYNGHYFQSWNINGKMTLGGINNSYGDLWLLSADAVPLVEVDNNGLKLWNMKDAGYLVNGTLYKDDEHQQLITPEFGAFYYDHVTGNVYKYDGSGYTAVEGNEGIMAQMVHTGLGLYSGDIDLKWNGQTGIYFKASDQEGTSDTLQIGDFLVMTEGEYGRQIWQSSDEMTGMSGEPAELGQYFLWAGWRSDDDFAFAVEDQGGGGNDNTVVRGHLIVNNRDILTEIDNLWDAVHSSDDDEGGDGPEGGTSGESGGTGPGYEGGNGGSSFDDLVDYYGDEGGG